MPNLNYAALITNDGSGNFTLSVKSGATLSGGSALLGGGSDLVSALNTTQLGVAAELFKLVVENDRAANG